MPRRLLGVAAALAVAASATACSDETLSAPQDGPAYAKAPPLYACAFTGNPSVSNAANSYFTSTADKKTATDFIGLMQAGFTASSYAGARGSGFDLLSFTGQVSRGTTAGDTTSGGLLVRQVIQCMFDVEEENDVQAEPFYGWPSDKQFDFGRALASSAAGAFFVRGGTTDPATAPVVANDQSVNPDSTGNISGIAPQAGYSWPTIVSTGFTPDRVLIYGEPVDEGYDWKLIPRSTSFSPSATVALCPAATSSAGTSADMISQESVGVLGYVNADFICDTPPAQFALLGQTRVFAMLGRVTSSVGRWFEPTPLQAAVAFSTIGGSASGAKGDVFTLSTVDKVDLRFLSPPKPWPKTLYQSKDRITITVEVGQAGTNYVTPVGGVDVSLSAVNNNGFTKVAIVTQDGLDNGVTGCTIDGENIIEAPTLRTTGTVGLNGNSAPTTVTWENACYTKTGTVATVASSKAFNRSGGVGSVTSPKTNVKP